MNIPGGVDASRPKVLIWGAGGHARVVADIVRQAGHYEVAAFLDDTPAARHGTMMCGSEIVGGRERLAAFRAAGVEQMIVAIGDCSARLALAEVAKEAGFCLAHAIHPRAIVADDCRIGAGTVVAAGAVLNPGATCGDCVIINTSASVDHDCLIQDGVHVGPGVCLGGYVSVGRGTWIGLGAVIKDRVRIGDDSLIGAGALVLRDVPPRVVAYGLPARVIRPCQ